jgi:D-aminoacyl-tRNA deacylase
MIGLMQRVSHAQVSIEGRAVATIARGLLVLVAVVPEDTEARAARLLERILDYRVFADGDGRMNVSLREGGGGLLLVPQFTLAADTTRGTRPGFSTAAAPELARSRFEALCAMARQAWPDTACGVFGADMQVALLNYGPVTFWLES